MKKETETLTPPIQEYFKMLSPKGIPKFLNRYIETLPMKKQAKIGTTCGTIYSNLFSNQFWYSSLDHSIGVALIIWNFTQNQKQALAGLFHDIATPAFKHTIDYMKGDYETQESTEELTSEIIGSSKEIMKLLKEDGIKLEEVENYHIYPIADNDTPRLSSDRLEYTLSNGLGGLLPLWNLKEVKEMYEDIEIQVNEEEIPELGFKTKEKAERFVQGMRKLSNEYIENKTKFSMQFLADIMKKMSQEKRITIDDLYQLSEKEIIEKIENCKTGDIDKCFKIWKKETKIKESDKLVEGKYCVNISNAKIRYINPLVRQENKFVRLDTISASAKEEIEKAKNFKTKKYAYLDFNF